MRHSSFTNVLFITVYVEKQPVARKVLCVVYWCGKTILFLKHCVKKYLLIIISPFSDNVFNSIQTFIYMFAGSILSCVLMLVATALLGVQGCGVSNYYD